MKREIITIVSLCLLSGLLASSCSMNELGKAANTVNQLETDLYTMEIKDDVGFDLFLEQGGARNSDELGAFLSDYLSSGPFGKLKSSIEPLTFACSALSVQSPSGHALSGRNFDWDNCKALIIRSFPENAFASVSTVNLNFLGFGEDYTPKGLINQFKAVAGYYVPLDGINEKGLVVADLMAGDNEITDMNEEGKLHLTTTSAIRLLLDKASDVSQAIDLLQGVNMHSDIGSAHHLFIADATGRSVAVEWTGNQMKVIDSPVLNNHYLCEEKKGVCSSEQSLNNECKLLSLKEQANGIMTLDELTDAMFSVLSLPDASYYGGTQWTIAYDSSEKSATYHWRRDRAKSYSFTAGSGR